MNKEDEEIGVGNCRAKRDPENLFALEASSIRTDRRRRPILIVHGLRVRFEMPVLPLVVLVARRHLVHLPVGITVLRILPTKGHRSDVTVRPSTECTCQ